MNVYDTANKLASEIKVSEEYTKFKEAKKNLESNNELKTKVDEFEKMPVVVIHYLKKGWLKNITREIEKGLLTSFHHFP